MKRAYYFLIFALLGLIACETEPQETTQGTLYLYADNTEIYANGEDAVTFTVKDKEGAELEDASIYFADTHEALEGKQFKTKYAGEYSFYAKRGAAQSEAINITAKEDNDTPGPEPQEKELKLSVEPETIYVDESATFKVELEGNDVTSEATIYLKEGDVALEGATYTATAEGVYAFYAKYEDATSNSVELNVRMKIVEEEKPIKI